MKTVGRSAKTFAANYLNAFARFAPANVASGRQLPRSSPNAASITTLNRRLPTTFTRRFDEISYTTRSSEQPPPKSFTRTSPSSRPSSIRPTTALAILFDREDARRVGANFRTIRRKARTSRRLETICAASGRIAWTPRVADSLKAVVRSAKKRRTYRQNNVPDRFSPRRRRFFLDDNR